MFADAQSGVTAYEWAIGTTAGGTNVQNYTGVGTSTSATNGSLSLSLGTTYYVTVRATDGAGLQSTATLDGVTINRTRTWDGGGGADANWTTAANWAYDVAPVAGDTLVFAGATPSTVNNNFTAGTIFDSITFNTGGFTVSGNSVKLTPAGGVAINNVAGQNTVNLSITSDSTGTAVVQAGTLQLAPGAQGLVLSGGGVDIQSGRLVFSYSGSSPAAAVRAALTSQL